MPEVRRLEVLCAVARAGSLSGAALALSYTPSAVSQQIAALERETGSTLVTRGPRGARLTDAGVVLVTHARGILGRLEDAQRALDDLRELRAGRVRLASFHSAGATFMPAAVASFRLLHPHVQLHVRDADPAVVAELVRSAEVDVALYFRYSDMPAPARSEGVDELALLDDPVRVALPAGHPLAGHRAVHLDKLANETWVRCATPTCAPLLPRLAHRAGFEPSIAFDSGDYATVLGFVAAGVGVALVPQLALAHTPSDRLVIRPIADNAPLRHVSALAAPDPQRSPATNAMLHVLQKTADSHRQAPLPPIAAL